MYQFLSQGYHFPDGPYVEYIGNIPADKRGQVLTDLNREATRLVKEAIPVGVRRNEKGERMVNVGGTECMCGGTHVQNTADIRYFTATKIKKNKKNVRVSYNLNGE
ncbi:hypothetical protein GBAR_LOCUS8555 [Geodia barretti]|uniref:Threonyl/alanyl tRNA synthetase SAD domain-containing protein n=1 Tax=Geodia barretti TaxID=519541 RepID=A0AA35RMY3_GEOBA|nr:hypothetical protein GBAR_LOCUS8555 [Geodia barretti]